MNKKALSMAEYWMDLLFYFLLVVGFVVSIILKSAFLSYFVIILFGMMAGRILFFHGKTFPVYVVLLGFLIGFIIGSRFADWKLLVLFFLFGSALSYYLHVKDGSPSPSKKKHGTHRPLLRK